MVLLQLLDSVHWQLLHGEDGEDKTTSRREGLYSPDRGFLPPSLTLKNTPDASMVAREGLIRRPPDLHIRC